MLSNWCWFWWLMLATAAYGIELRCGRSSAGLLLWPCHCTAKASDRLVCAGPQVTDRGMAMLQRRLNALRAVWPPGIEPQLGRFERLLVANTSLSRFDYAELFEPMHRLRQVVFDGNRQLTHVALHSFQKAPGQVILDRFEVRNQHDLTVEP